MWRWKCFVCGRVYCQQWQGWLSWHTFKEECPDCARSRRRVINTPWLGKMAGEMATSFCKAFRIAR